MRGGSRSAIGLALLMLSTAAGDLAGAPHALAAAPQLHIVSTATYEVRPDERLVHVSVRGTATSYAADSGGSSYYFPAMRVVIFAGVTGLSARASGAAARVTLVNGDDHQQVIEVALNRDLFYRQSTSFTLDYDLPTGASGGEVRVGANVARFPVWAVGSSETEGSSVAISLPPGFRLDLQGDSLPDAEPRDDGGRIYRWTAIADPDTFWLFATADQATITKDTYREFDSQATVPGATVRIVVRAWADDPDWGTRTSQRITEALPVLGDLIGVRYFGTASLVVVETVSRSLNGYAGIFDSSQASDEIQVSFDADDTVTLHEAAHAWFNGSLSSDRWILEGYASYYGGQAAEQLGIPADPFQLTNELRALRFPLAEWGNVGSESASREEYAYAASLEVATEIADRAGLDDLSAVFSAMAADESAYQPLHAASVESSYAHATNWHYFLDLLEERTGQRFDDIMRTWVAPTGDRQLLDDRAHARAAYVSFVASLGGWEVPEPLRRQMNGWAFAEAEQSMDQAASVLAGRDRLAARAEELALQVPLDDVQADFHNDAMERAAQTEQTIDATLDAYDAALAASRRELDLVETIGLIGAGPAADLAAAEQAVESGEWADATSAADRAAATWTGAASEGTTRIAIGGGTALLLAVGGVSAATVRRRRGRARRAAVPGDEAA